MTGSNGRHPSTLASLRKSGAKSGNGRAVTHGGKSSPANLIHLEATRAALFEWLAATAPIREQGELPEADYAVVEDCARAWARVRQMDDWIAQHGPLDKRGRPRPALDLLERASKNLVDKLAALGMTPRSRVALGVDVARATSLAEAMSEKDATKRKALLAELGLGGDSDGDGER